MARNKRKRVRLTSPQGTAKYPYLNIPDTQWNPEGEYKTGLLLDPNEHQEFLDRLDEIADKAVEKAKADLEKAKKKAQAKQVIRQAPYREDYDQEGEPTGLVEVRFKSKAKIKTRDGKEMELKPALFDAKGHALDASKVSIWGGSEIKVNFTPSSYYVAGTKLAGVTLQLNAVQIIELVSGSGGGTADSFGFEAVEDGFDSSQQEFSTMMDKADEDYDNEEEYGDDALEGVDF